MLAAGIAERLSDVSPGRRRPHNTAGFTPAALRRLARAAQGIVRRINILADKALLAAFADDAQQVSARHVRLAIADSAFTARHGTQASCWRAPCAR
ncbi:hypothetical protein BA896_019920 [Janthinobacterium lividum]|uniref:Uncharacterized protein n=1 Tax=Janthinobacterium lividum TaxID=29581 RepID=A0A1E8PKV8_9BURK|nr:hypothetical protein BA896_019920 [Janthinobacterium lividum]